MSHVFLYAFPALFLVTQSAMALDSEQQPREIYPIVQVINSEIRLIKVSSSVSIEQMTGKAAREHLASLKARRPEVFRKGEERMRALGHREPGQVFVERTLTNTLGRDGNISQSSPYKLADTSSESSADGEIDFESWDGPDWTWQGNIYVNVYGYGESTWSGEIDTDSTDYPWNWVDETWASPNCTPHCGPDNQGRLAPPRPGDLTHGVIQLAASHGPIRNVDWNWWYNWSTCYRSGVLGGCGSAATGCWRAKGGWPACFALWCVGAEIGSAIGCAL